MSTPARRRALKALAQRKASNRKRIAAGKKPIIEGKAVSPAKFAAETSTTVGAIKRSIKKKKRKRSR